MSIAALANLFLVGFIALFDFSGSLPGIRTESLSPIRWKEGQDCAISKLGIRMRESRWFADVREQLGGMQGYWTGEVRDRLLCIVCSSP